jgi:hypothetical protein
MIMAAPDIVASRLRGIRCDRIRDHLRYSFWAQCISPEGQAVIADGRDMGNGVIYAFCTPAEFLKYAVMCGMDDKRAQLCSKQIETANRVIHKDHERRMEFRFGGEVLKKMLRLTNKRQNNRRHDARKRNAERGGENTESVGWSFGRPWVEEYRVALQSKPAY